MNIFVVQFCGTPRILLFFKKFRGIELLGWWNFRRSVNIDEISKSKFFLFFFYVFLKWHNQGGSELDPEVFISNYLYGNGFAVLLHLLCCFFCFIQLDYKIYVFLHC